MVPDVTNKARLLRRSQTESEKMLWDAIRGSKIGFKIVRQKPILFRYNGQNSEFIADFYCKKAGVIIEVDGQIHQKQVEYDQIRTELLSVMQLEVIRFSNDMIHENIAMVVASIMSFLRKRREDVAKRQERGGI